MTIAQAQQFMAAATGSELEAMWAVMISLGVRPGEAAGLCWDDIDLDQRITHVRRAHKAAEKGKAAIGETTTTGSVRSLDTPPIVPKAPASVRGNANTNGRTCHQRHHAVDGLLGPDTDHSNDTEG